MSLRMDIQILAEKCLEETTAYIQKHVIEANYCFELMRHALELDNSEAFSHMYNNYIRLVLSWVLRHPAYESTQEPVDYFASNAFAMFYFANKKEKFSKLHNVGAALKYLKACVHTGILQHLRYDKPTIELEEDRISTTYEMDKNILANQIWSRIRESLDDLDDLYLANLRYIQNMKPKDIAQENPQRWGSPRDVSVDLQRIKRTLSKDEILYQLLRDSKQQTR